MKQCSICLDVKNLDQFNKNKVKPDGLQTICRPCSNERSKRYYQLNPEKHKKNVRVLTEQYRHRNKRFILKIKRSSWCLVCFERDECCTDFHHLRDKKFNISDMIDSTLQKIQEEIEKCVLICSNCHRKYHAGRFSLLTDKPT